MHAGVAFEELLDQRLGAPAVAVHGALRGVPPGTATTYGFFFLESLPGMAAPITAPVVGTLAPAQSAAPVNASSRLRDLPADDPCRPGPAHGVTRRPASSSRPGCRLSSRQQAAVEELVALGACIGEDISRRELRSVFRALARRYHPDRHAGAGCGDRAHLAAQFARLCNAYRLLADSI